MEKVRPKKIGGELKRNKVRQTYPKSRFLLVVSHFRISSIRKDLKKREKAGRGARQREREVSSKNEDGLLCMTVRLLNLLSTSSTHNAIKAMAYTPSKTVNPTVAFGAIRVPLDLLTNRTIQKVFFLSLRRSTQQKRMKRQAANPAISLNWMKVE